MNRLSQASLLTLALLAVLALAAPAPALAGAPQKLTDNTFAESGTDVAVDPEGTIHVVYERDSTIYYRARTEEGWGAEEMVAPGVSPTVGAGASGIPQVVFLDMGQAKHTARIADAWVTPAPLGPAVTADLAVDAGDVAHVVVLGNIETSDGYNEMYYRNNAAGGTWSEPRVWDSWYDGSAAVYYYAPVITAYAEGAYAIGYRLYQMWRGSGWTDWYTSIHVYRSLTDDDLSNDMWYKGTYPDPQHNGLVLSPTGAAQIVFGATLGLAGTGPWTAVPLPAGSSFTLDASPAGTHLGFVNSTGGIDYVLATGGSFGTPLNLDPTTSGRNPVVKVAATGPIVVYEAVDSVDHEVWLAKTTNEAPVLDAIGEKSVDEEDVLSFTISATDGDEDELTYEATDLPSGATFDAETQTFTWTPSWDASGTYDVTFTVDDGVDSDSETITITVNHVNQPPVFDTIGNKTVDENEEIGFTVVATDVDNDTLTFGLSGLPPGASFDPDTQQFSWTPGYDDAGEYTLHFQVTDDGEPKLTTYETITITVGNTNRAPELADVGDRSVDEEASLSFTVSATDADDDTLTYSASGLPTGATFDPSTRAFSWSPGYGDSGPHTATFAVSDGTDTDSETITITVNNVNRAPELATIGSQSVDEGATLAFTVSADDPDGDELKLSATGLPASATFDTSTGSFSWSPDHTESGEYSVTFSVVDEEDSDSETVTITVNNVNRAPVLDAIGEKGVNEGATLSFTVSGTDADGQTLTYGASGLPTGAALDTGTGGFSWSPGYASAGDYDVTFSVSDGTDTDTETVTIVVSNVNRAPVLGAIGDRSVNEGASLSFALAATDEDGDTLTYSARSLPTGATFDGSTRTFSWTPGYTQSGTYSGVTFETSDGHDTDGEKITITVIEVNRAPVLAAIGAKTVKAEKSLSFTVSATDDDADALTYSASGLPTGASFDPSTRTFSWTPSKTQAGTYSVVFTVTDDGTPNAGDTETVTILVTGPGVDFNGDGKSDILWHNQANGELYAWMLDGTVTTGGSYLTPKAFADTSWQIRGLADFTGDGKTDVLWHHQVSGDLYVWSLDGTVTTGGGYLTPKSFADANWKIRGVGDFDGDSKPDILWHNQASGELYLWYMNGLVVKGGSYLTPKSFADTRWQIRGLADFNGDGKLDILWHHQTNGELYVWYLDGAVTTGGSYLTPKAFADTQWKIVKLADFDADGKQDLLWHHQASGELYVWFLDGTVVKGGGYLTPKSFSDTNWKVVPQ